jgi:hypothetical protein
LNGALRLPLPSTLAQARARLPVQACALGTCQCPGLGDPRLPVAIKWQSWFQVANGPAAAFSNLNGPL